VEDARGHDEAAIRLEYDALRYGYLAGTITSIATSYHNLGSSLRNQAQGRTAALACHLAAALLRTLTGADGVGDSVRAAGGDLRELPAAPRDVAEAAELIGDIPGTDLPGLITSLAPDAESAERVFQELLAQAAQLAVGPRNDGTE
jgi:hypothetical protein